jgi:hypothetical protein
LGFAFESGHGVSKNEAEALKWYRKAAESGSAQAMNWMGVTYRDGRGVAKNGAEADKWIRKAAALGDKDAKAYLQKAEVGRKEELLRPALMQSAGLNKAELAKQEELRLKALTQQAARECDAGDSAMKSEQYLTAAKCYEMSLAHLRQAGPSLQLGSLSNKLANAYGLASEEALNRGDGNKALSYANSALAFDAKERNALRVQRKILK